MYKTKIWCPHCLTTNPATNEICRKCHKPMKETEPNNMNSDYTTSEVESGIKANNIIVSQKRYGIAEAIKVIGIGTIIISFIAFFILSSNDMSSALFAFIGGIVIGIVQLGFAEIIILLESINNQLKKQSDTR